MSQSSISQLSSSFRQSFNASNNGNGFLTESQGQLSYMDNGFLFNSGLQTSFSNIPFSLQANGMNRSNSSLLSKSMHSMDGSLNIDMINQYNHMNSSYSNASVTNNEESFTSFISNPKNAVNSSFPGFSNNYPNPSISLNPNVPHYDSMNNSSNYSTYPPVMTNNNNMNSNSYMENNTSPFNSRLLPTMDQHNNANQGVPPRPMGPSSYPFDASNRSEPPVSYMPVPNYQSSSMSFSNVRNGPKDEELYPPSIAMNSNFNNQMNEENRTKENNQYRLANTLSSYEQMLGSNNEMNSYAMSSNDPYGGSESYPPTESFNTRMNNNSAANIGNEDNTKDNLVGIPTVLKRQLSQVCGLFSLLCRRPWRVTTLMASSLPFLITPSPLMIISILP